MYTTRVMPDLVRHLLTRTQLDLIGGEVFALDGCKLSSNIAKEWSGTFSELEKKKKTTCQTGYNKINQKSQPTLREPGEKNDPLTDDSILPCPGKRRGMENVVVTFKTIYYSLLDDDYRIIEQSTIRVMFKIKVVIKNGTVII